tara:strand:- start:103 stop:1173 length:1071 start_codon:yes stop_codon:yes gene_type:complete
MKPNLILKLLFIMFSFIACKNEKHEDKIQRQLISYFEEQDFRGIVQAYIDDSLFFEKALGYVDYESKRTINLNSRFHICSVTKTFTAVAIMMLKEQEELEYSDSLALFFKSFPNYLKGITIHQLLSHTSGIPDYLNHYPSETDTLYNYDVIETLMQKDSLLFKSGSKYRYSNAGYVILALIIEEITNTRYEDFIKDNIFSKLNMNNTSFLGNNNFLDTNYLYGENEDGLNWDIPIYTRGDIGIISTVNDLHKWSKALRDNLILSEEETKNAFTNKVESKSEIHGRGYGFVINEPRKGYKFVGHNGSLGGVEVKFLMQLSPNKFLIIVSNDNDGKYLNQMLIDITMILNDIEISKPE